MICDVCGSENFETYDGLYYCSLCNTQSQKSQVVVNDAFDDSGQKRFGTRVRGSSKRRKKKSLPDCGKDWISIHAFNMVLSMQVKKLNELGVPASFKTTVLALWIQYLKTCETAFLNSKRRNQYPKLNSKIRNRDMHLLVKGKVRVTVRRKKKVKKRILKTRTELSCESEVTSLESGLSCADSQSDNESGTSDNSSIVVKQKGSIRRMLSSVAKSTRKQVEHRQGKFPNEIRSSKLPDVMTLEKTLCFIYLGLLLHQSPLQLCDIIRWLREGHLPGMDATQCLPSSMKLQTGDHAFLRMTRIPSTWFIFRQSEKLMNLLKISPSAFTGPPAMSVVARFVDDLNLPSQILFVIHHLLSLLTQNHENSKFHIPVRFQISKRTTPEIRAMAMILVALKLLFGLDDVMESAISQLAHELMSQNISTTLFIWDEWAEHTKLKMYLLEKNHVPQKEMDHSNVTNVKNVSEFYQNVLLKLPVASSVAKKDKCELPEFREALRSAFIELKCQSSVPVSSFPAPTLYPLHAYTKLYIENSPGLSANLEKKLKRDFSNCSISYLLPANVHNGSTCIDTLGNGYREVPLPHKRYWVMCKMEKLIGTRPKFLTRLPKSFQWLLHVCSNLIESTPESICREMGRIENLILNRMKALK